VREKDPATHKTRAVETLICSQDARARPCTSPASVTSLAMDHARELVGPIGMPIEDHRKAFDV